MPIFKQLRLKGGGPTLHNALVLRRMSLNITPSHNPFSDDGLDGGRGWSPGGSLLDGDVPRDRNPFEDEEDENAANEERGGGADDKGVGANGRGGSGGKGGGFKLVSPLRTLGKLGKSLRASGRRKDGGTPSPSESPGEKKKRGRRSSEGSLLRFAGRYRDSLSRKDTVSNGDPGSEEDSQSRRLSLMKMVLGKHKRESGSERVSVGPEPGPEPEPEEVVKPREPLSVLEILQLVKKRDLLLADAHILELEQEVAESCDQSDDSGRDNGRRRAKDVELLYEELQKELWAVVREALRNPTSGPNLGLAVQVLQQEEQVDQQFLASRTEVWVPSSGPRPRRLRQRWVEAIGEMADSALPLKTEFTAGFLDRFLGQIRTRVMEDLSAAKRNVVPIYPPEYQPFQVYVQSYHAAVTKRLSAITERPLETTDGYSLLHWVYNIYNREVLDPLGGSGLPPLLCPDTVDRLELDLLNSVRAVVTSELAQLLEDEEKRWMETLHIEEFTLPLSSSVIQRLEKDLERSASVNHSLGSRVAQCSLNGLADFYYSFQRKVELFHEGLQSGMFVDNEDGYVSKTIAQVNCCPPFRDFAQRCAQSDPVQNQDSLRRASRALDSVVQTGVRVLTDRLYYGIKPLFERLVKRKWLSNTEPFEQIQTIIKETFKKYQRMDPPPYQVLVSEVHRRVVTEYLRALMRGRLICTSAKMRRRAAARLRDEGSAIKALFSHLGSRSSWLDGALSHLAEILDLDDLPSVQMEVGVLLQEYPDVRRKHVAAVLSLRGLTRQSERAEVLNVLKDLEQSLDSASLTRDRALFAEVPVTSELHCVNVGLSRLALSATSWFSCALRTKSSQARGPRAQNQAQEEEPGPGLSQDQD